MDFYHITKYQYTYWAGTFLLDRLCYPNKCVGNIPSLFVPEDGLDLSGLHIL